MCKLCFQKTDEYKQAQILEQKQKEKAEAEAKKQQEKIREVLKDKRNTTGLKAQVQALINKTTTENEKQKKLLNHLFKKLDEIKEIEAMERMREFENGKFLQ